MYIYTNNVVSDTSLQITYANQKLLRITFLQETPTNDGTRTAFSDVVFKELHEYFLGQRRCFSFSYETHGTPFQEKVWQALRHIPYGETRSYKDIAIAFGQPTAARAVGLANHQNPLPIVIPCHRVIAADGHLGGYIGGQAFKAALLRMEALHK